MSSSARKTAGTGWFSRVITHRARGSAMLDPHLARPRCGMPRTVAAAMDRIEVLA
jgi:hypothetical protein